MKSVFLNIGSNKGDRLAAIERAVTLVADHPLMAEGRIRRAPVVYTAPVGYDSDAEFANLGIAVDFPDTAALPDPFELLDALQHIERAIAPESPHRNADGTYRDRIIDIDIIAIEGVRVDTERLTLPHPRAAARRFVTRPLAFLTSRDVLTAAPDVSNPHVKKTVDQMGRDSVESFKTKRKTPVALILDNIRSQNNIGSMFRTADAFCIEHIALCGITACPPSPEIHKTALGAEDAVDWRHYRDTLDAVACLREMGFIPVCLEQVVDSVSLDAFVPDPARKYAIVVGNEVNGVAQSVVNACDVCIEIPQDGTKHSLNVAVSAAVALWHFYTSLRR